MQMKVLVERMRFLLLEGAVAEVAQVVGMMVFGIGSSEGSSRPRR